MLTKQIVIVDHLLCVLVDLFIHSSGPFVRSGGPFHAF